MDKSWICLQEWKLSHILRHEKFCSAQHNMYGTKRNMEEDLLSDDIKLKLQQGEQLVCRNAKCLSDLLQRLQIIEQKIPRLRQKFENHGKENLYAVKSRVT